MTKLGTALVCGAMLCGSSLQMHASEVESLGRNGRAVDNVAVADSSFLKNLLKDVVGAITTVKEDAIYGTGMYKGAACRFLTDDLLKKAGGELAANELEKKLDETLAKVGVKEGVSYYTFNEDKTFSTKLGKKVLEGTYVYDLENQTMELTFFKLAKMQVAVRREGKNMNLLFDADKILKLLTAISSFSNMKSVVALGKLAEQYDGLQMGYQLEKAADK